MIVKIMYGALVFIYSTILRLIILKSCWSWFVVDHFGLREISLTEAYGLCFFMQIFNLNDHKLNEVPNAATVELLMTEDQRNQYRDLVWKLYKKAYFNFPITHTFKAVIMLAMGYFVSHFLLSSGH